jgi:3-oxoacyl-[acyl-carrier-protein] synthase-1
MTPPARHAPADIVAVGMTTPVGLSAAQTAASVRAGIARTAESEFIDRDGDPLVMGLASDAELPPLVAALAARGFSPRQERVVRLGGAALADALEARPVDRPPPLCLGIAAERRGPRHAVGIEMLDAVALQAGQRIDLSRSQVFPVGRAAGLVALDHALTLLDRRQAPLVVVGAVDSYWDRGLLEGLESDGRLKTGRGADGFIPGEGAAFVVLAAAPADRDRDRDNPRVVALGQGHEPGHLYSDEPYHGEGLAAAFESLFHSAPALEQPIGSVYAGLNGESHWAKEWGVSYLRNAARFAEPLRLEHPVDCMGDPGAALGMIMLGLATLHLRGEPDGSSALIWCSSDTAERAAALLTR